MSSLGTFYTLRDGKDGFSESQRVVRHSLRAAKFAYSYLSEEDQKEMKDSFSRAKVDLDSVDLDGSLVLQGYAAEKTLFQGKTTSILERKLGKVFLGRVVSFMLKYRGYVSDAKARSPAESAEDLSEVVQAVSFNVLSVMRSHEPLNGS